MSFADDWIRRARARHWALIERHAAGANLAGRTVVITAHIPPRHGKTKTAAALLAAGLLGAYRGR